MYTQLNCTVIPVLNFILAVCTIRVYVSKTLYLSIIMHLQCRHDEKDQILCFCHGQKNHPIYLFSCNLSEDHVKSSSSSYQQLDLAEAVISAVSVQAACSCKLPSLWPPAPLLRQDADQGKSSSLQPLRWKKLHYTDELEPICWRTFSYLMKEWVTHLFLQRRPSGLFSVYINPLCCRLLIFACGLKDSRVIRNTNKYKKVDGRQHQAYLLDEKICILLQRFTRRGEAVPRTESSKNPTKSIWKWQWKPSTDIITSGRVFVSTWGSSLEILIFRLLPPGGRSKRFSGYCPRVIRQEDHNRTMGRRQEGPSDHLTFWGMVKNNSKT
jgi:hypothetical protein